MTKRKTAPRKAAQEAAPTQPATSDETPTGAVLDAIAMAARRGVSEFMKCDPFKDEKWRKRAPAVAARVVEVLPRVVKCLLTGFFARETGERPSSRDAEKKAISGISAHGMWDENLGIIMFHAALGHKDFFEHLGKGLYEDRKPQCSPAQAFLQVCWHEWGYPKMSAPAPANFPGLKFWRDEAVQKLLNEMYFKKRKALTLTAYRSMRDRLGLRAEKRKKVKGRSGSRDDDSEKLRIIVKP
jgi:hypothetical protein